MKYVKQFGIIVGVSFLGELLKVLLPFPMPASIYGLLIMFLALCTGIMKLEQVESAADFLVEIMPLMFIPAGVGLMKEWDILSKIWIPFAGIIVVSTIAVMVVTGKVTQRMIKNDKCSTSDEAASKNTPACLKNNVPKTGKGRI